MNISELSAKIKITVEQQELNKLNDAFEELKKKIKEYNKRLEENKNKQKESGEEAEKLAEKTEEAADATEKQADANKELAEKTKQATSESHGFLSVVERIIKAVTKWTLALGVLTGSALNKAYEKAGKLGTSLRLISSDFGLSPESLQRWQMLAETAGSSSDAMSRILQATSSLKRNAVINPYYMPPSLNIAGIRPANYGSTEDLLKAIVRAGARFTNERKRLAWLEASGFDAADFNMIIKEYMRNGNKFDDTFFISNENVEKLNKITVATSKLSRLGEAIKNNFLAAISDDFVKQVEAVTKWILEGTKALEKFFSRHGGISKVLGDISSVLPIVTKVANAFATLSSVISQFGLFTTTLLVIGGILYGILKVVDWIVASFKSAVGLVGTMKELFFGLMAMKLENLIATGNIPEEYLPEAQKAQKFFKEGAGVYQDPKAVTKGIADILEWLSNIPSKVAESMASVLVSAILKGVDYLIDSILTLWADSGLPFSEMARDILNSRYVRIPENERSSRQKAFIEDYRKRVGEEAEGAVPPPKTLNSLRTALFGSEEEKRLESERVRATGIGNQFLSLFKDLKNFSDRDAAMAVKLLGMMNREGSLDVMPTKMRENIVDIQNVVNINGNEPEEQQIQKVKKAMSGGTLEGLKQATGIGTGN